MLESLATACAGLFAGAAVYITLVQQPALREVGDTTAVIFFPPMYRRAAPVQAGLAFVGTLSGLLAWLSGADVTCLVGALFLGSVIPLTLIQIKPVNDRLMEVGLELDSPDAAALLDRWARLHALRSGASLAALMFFLLR